VEDTQQPSQQQPGRVGDREQPAPGETGPDHPTRKAQAGEEPREGRDEEGRGSVALEIRRGERVGGLGAFNQIELLAEPNERSVNLLLESEPNQVRVSQFLHAKAGKPCTTVVLDRILKPYT